MRILIATLASILGVGGALAADLPPAPPPQAPAVYIPPPPVYNWSGIYAGINGGWGWGKAKWTAFSAGPPVGFGTLTSSASDSGGVVGGTLGFNFQTGGFVFGVEGDFDYSGVNTGTSSTLCATLGTCQTGNNWLSTFRGRAGYAWDRILFYGTAGGAFGNAQTTFNGITTTHTQTGWTVGAGMEVAFADNWTGKIEYLYVDLGSTTNNSVTAAGVPFTATVGLTDSLLRLGINYKFRF
jgi:outer membrane immunogenic protein